MKSNRFMYRTRYFLLLCLLLAFGRAHATGIWLSKEEINQLPDSGSAWENVVSKAQSDTNDPTLADQNTKIDTNTVAKALIYARTGDTTYGNEVLYTLQRLVELNPVERSDEWQILATLRAMGAYVIAADLVDLKTYSPEFDKNTFRPWLAEARFALTGSLDGGGSLVSKHRQRPNNFGTHASASRIAIDLYLNDSQDLNEAIQIFKGWLGDRSSYSGFKYGDLSWQANPDAPVGINPKGSTINGKNVDGVLPDDARRCGSFNGDFCKSNYMWEGLQGAVVAAEMLHRAGYPAYEWSDRALLRAIEWLHNTTFEDGKNYPAEGDDIWQIYIINKRYGTSFPTGGSSSPSVGKMMGFTDWTHTIEFEGTEPLPEPEPEPEPTPEPEPEPTPEPEPEPTPEPEPEPSSLSVDAAKFWSSTGNLRLSMSDAAPGSTILVKDRSGKTVSFGSAPADGSPFNLKQAFYTTDGSCSYYVTDGNNTVGVTVSGSRKYGCGKRARR